MTDNNGDLFGYCMPRRVKLLLVSVCIRERESERESESEREREREIVCVCLRGGVYSKAGREKMMLMST